MRKISISENVMRPERLLFLYFLPMHRAQSMRVTIGTRISGMLTRMEEILIFRDHFSSNGESFKSLYRCQGKSYPMWWKILTTRITVEIWKTAISASTLRIVKIAITVTISTLHFLVWILSDLLIRPSAMSSSMRQIVIVRIFPMTWRTRNFRSFSTPAMDVNTAMAVRIWKIRNIWSTMSSIPSLPISRGSKR
jgi:hypothetical protein